MADHTLFVGLDVHRRTIAVATAPDEVRRAEQLDGKFVLTVPGASWAGT